MRLRLSWSMSVECNGVYVRSAGDATSATASPKPNYCRVTLSRGRNLFQRLLLDYHQSPSTSIPDRPFLVDGKSSIKHERLSLAGLPFPWRSSPRTNHPRFLQVSQSEFRRPFPPNLGIWVLGRVKADNQTPAATIAKRKRAAEAANRILTEDEEEEEDWEEETLSWSDSLFFPVFGSIALLGLWFLLKYVGKEWINFVLGLYCESILGLRSVRLTGEVSGAGVFAFQSVSLLDYPAEELRADETDFQLIGQLLYSPNIIQSTDLSHPNILQPEAYDHSAHSTDLQLMGPEIFHHSISLSSIILLPFSIALPLLYVPLGRPWILSNVLALSLGTATLAILKLDSFLTAFMLLGVLLIYDIFWVSPAL